MIEKFSVWKWRMHIHTPGWHTFYFITFVSFSISWWRSWRSGGRCRHFWRRCGGSFPPPAGHWVLCCTYLAWMAASRMIFVNHCRVSFPRSLHLVMPRKLNSSLLLFSDFGARYLNSLLCFLYCGARTAGVRGSPLAVILGLVGRLLRRIPRQDLQVLQWYAI